MNLLRLLMVMTFTMTASLVHAEEAVEAATGESTSVSATAFHRLTHMHPIGTVWKLLDSNPVLKRQEWWGWRQNLEEKGMTFTVVYTGDMVTNTSGGTKKGTAYLGNLDLTMTVDTEKMGLWQGGTFFVYGLYNFNSSPATGKYVGDAQGVDNIEAARLFKLFELWYEHAFMDGKVSARAGLYNINSEFAVSDYAGLYLNSSFGIEPAFSLNTTPSIFPLTGPAFRLKVDPTENITLLGAVITGNPGDEDSNPHGLDIAFNKRRGVMVVGEAQLHGDVPLPGLGSLPGAIKFGAWNNNNDVDAITELDADANLEQYGANYGFYGVIDQMIFREQDEQGLGVFLQVGTAPSDRNTYTQYYGYGLNYTGLLPNRDADTFGVAMNHLKTGAPYRSTGTYDDYEHVLEVTYQMQVTEAITIQPDFQWVKNPNHDPSVDDAKVFLLRTKISF